MAASLAACSQCLAAIGGLVRNPRPDDEGWRHDLALQAARLGALRAQIAGLKGAPVDLRQVHAGILEASSDVAEALSSLTGDGRDGSHCDVERMADLIAQGGERLCESADKMLEYLSQLT